MYCQSYCGVREYSDKGGMREGDSTWTVHVLWCIYMDILTKGAGGRVTIRGQYTYCCCYCDVHVHD